MNKANSASEIMNKLQKTRQNILFSNENANPTD